MCGGLFSAPKPPKMPPPPPPEPPPPVFQPGSEADQNAAGAATRKGKDALKSKPSDIGLGIPTEG